MALSRFFLILFLVFTPFFSAHAQIIPEKSFFLENENKPVKINLIFKRHDGYLYLGTENGLYNFDGLRFTRINFVNPDYTDEVSAIYEDNNQGMWLGFSSGRIASVINNKLVYWNPEEGTPQKKINALITDKDNNLWFSASGEGLYYYRNNRMYLLNREDGLPDQNINALALAENGDILAGTDQGLLIVRLTDDKPRISFLGPKDGLPDYIISAMKADGSKGTWLGFNQNGFCLYNHTTGEIKKKSGSWENQVVTSLNITVNSIWIGTESKGVLAIDRSNDAISNPAISLSGYISSIQPDNFGNIWLTGKDNRLTRIAGESVKLYPLPPEAQFEHLHTVLKDRDGKFWITNIQNELLCYNASLESLERKITLPGVTEKTDITSLFQDETGMIWAGTVGRGLFMIDPATAKTAVVKLLPGDATILSVSGKKTDVFVSSLQGAFKISRQPGRGFEISPFNLQRTGNHYVYAIHEDSRGDIWFATDGTGIIRLRNGEYSVYSKPILKDDRIYSIAEDKQGMIWFNTANSGIYRYNGDTFKNFAIAEGISDLNIASVACDKKGHILIINKKGIDIIDPGTERINYLNTGISGKINSEDLDAISSDQNGNIYVSTSAGILSYSPSLEELPYPRSIIESVQLFNTSIGEDDHTFSYDENNFTIHYTGLYYTDPEQILFQYKLEGFDSAWITTTDRSKSFARLPPGKYTFRIRTSLNKNFTEADEANYSFTIEQAFYKTWWFLALCILLAGVIAVWVISIRERSLKKIERLRQEKIQSQFEVLRNQINPHFLFNSFNTLISIIDEDPKIAIEYVEQLSDYFRDIVKYRDKEIITLGEELDLLQNYFYLQQKRFGDHIRLTVEIPEEKKQSEFIPPLTLQLLMENALKHNVVSAASPLEFNVSTSGPTLLVSNNISIKKTNEKRAGMGLQNIISRYRLLTNKQVSISQTDNNFIVSLPLIYNA